MNEATKVETGTAIPGYEPLKPDPPKAEAQFDLGEVKQVEMTPEEEAYADPLAHPLSKPISAHGEQITILHWREPTGGDIEKAGNPIAINTTPGDDNARVAFDERKMAAMISQLAGIPPSSVRQLSARDWNAIAFKIFRFFL